MEKLLDWLSDCVVKNRGVLAAYYTILLGFRV